MIPKLQFPLIELIHCPLSDQLEKIILIKSITQRQRMSLMLNNSTNFKRQSSHLEQSQSLEANPHSVRDLQNTINPHDFLTNKHLCRCDLCARQKIVDETPSDGNLFQGKSMASTHWLKKLLDNLCLSGARTLKLHLPDLLFVEGQSLQTFQSSRKDGRLIKLSGTTPFKSLYPTLIRYRKQYKYMLELNFNQKMLQSIDPQFMHLSYFDKFVPSYFHDGMNNIEVLQENKNQFRRYILHKSKKYQIQQIQEHKMNHKQPFVLVKYTDGNCQLFNQIQFQVYMLSTPQKLQEDISFVQTYIKYKLETQAIYYSEYTLDQESIGSQVDRRAEKEVMVLIGGLHKYQEGYIDIDSIEEITHELMLKRPKEYVELMTYKILHYLNMTSRMYIDHLKLKWIMNDLGNIYLQEVMEFQMSEVPRRLIRYRLPVKDQVLDVTSHSNNFGQLYLEMKRRKFVNTARIKEMVKGRPIEEILDMMEGQEYPKGQTIKNKGKMGNKHKEENKNIKTSGPSQGNNQIGRYSLTRDKRYNQTQTKQRYSSITFEHYQQCRSQRRGRLSLKMNKYFTITPTKQQKRSKCAVQSSQTQRTIKLNPSDPTKKQDNRCGSTLSTLKGIKNGL